MDCRCAYPADSPIPDTFTAKAETLLGDQLPDDPLAKSARLWYANSSSASPIWPLRPARHLRHQDLCAAV